MYKLLSKENVLQSHLPQSSIKKPAISQYGRSSSKETLIAPHPFPDDSHTTIDRMPRIRSPAEPLLRRITLSTVIFCARHIRRSTVDQRDLYRYLLTCLNSIIPKYRCQHRSPKKCLKSVNSYTCPPVADTSCCHSVPVRFSAVSAGPAVIS